MAPNSTLGKRKRKTAAPTNDEDDEAARQKAQEVFRRHFEARFKPLPEVQKPIVPAPVTSEDETLEEEKEWGGISEDEETTRVVEHTDAYTRMAVMSKEQLKAFMVYPFPL